jgi:hypothetical protein
LEADCDYNGHESLYDAADTRSAELDREVGGAIREIRKLRPSTDQWTALEDNVITYSRAGSEQAAFKRRRVYMCDICGNSYTRAEHLDWHREGRHDINPHRTDQTSEPTFDVAPVELSPRFIDPRLVRFEDYKRLDEVSMLSENDELAVAIRTSVRRGEVKENVYQMLDLHGATRIPKEGHRRGFGNLTVSRDETAPEEMKNMRKLKRALHID